MLAITAAVAVLGGAYLLLKDRTLENAQAAVETAEAEKKHITTMIDRKEKASKLAEEYKKLAEKENRSAKETERMENLYGEISAAYPKLTSGTRDWGQRLEEVNGVIANGASELNNLNDRLAQTQELLTRERMTLALEEAKKASKDYVSGVGGLFKVEAQEFEDRTRRMVESAEFNLRNQKSAAEQIAELEDVAIRRGQIWRKAEEEGDKKTANRAREQVTYLRGVIDSLKEAETQVQILSGAETELAEKVNVSSNVFDDAAESTSAAAESTSAAAESTSALAEETKSYLDDMKDMEYQLGKLSYQEYKSYLVAKMEALRESNEEEYLQKLQLQQKIAGLDEEERKRLKELNKERIELVARLDEALLNAALNMRYFGLSGQAVFDIMKNTFESVENGLSSLVMDIVDGTKSMGNALKDFVTGIAKSMLKMITQVLAKMAIMATIKAIFSGATGGFGLLALKAAERLASGGLVHGSGYGDSVPAMLTPGEFVVRRDVAQSPGMLEYLQRLNTQESGEKNISFNLSGMSRNERELYIRDLRPGGALNEAFRHLGGKVVLGGI
jgi:hypothetical protein